jgi:uncharacterized protein (TIGR02996 family)
MTDREALQRAILHNPDDDTPRLIFADFLDEEGEPDRAAFIRAQVELAGTPEYDPRWVRARYHDRDALTGRPWLDSLPPLPSHDGLSWPPEPFRRGFPTVVRAYGGAAFAEHADAVFALAPVDSLELWGVRTGEPELTDSPWLSRLRALSLPEGISRITAQRVLNSAHLTRLTDLRIGSGMTPPVAADVIVSSRAFKRLTAFGYRDDSRTHAIVTALTRLADPPHLERLDLASNRITADTLEYLLGAPVLEGVVELDLSDNNLRGDGVRAMADASLPALRVLKLTRTVPDAGAVRALAESPQMDGLRSLSLAGNVLPHRAAVAVAQSPRAANLRVLDFRTNRVGAAGAAAIAHSSHMRGLIELNLSENLIEDPGAFALAESPHLDALVALDVSANLFTPPAVARLRDRFGDRVIV